MNFKAVFGELPADHEAAERVHPKLKSHTFSPSNPFIFRIAALAIAVGS